MTDVQIVRSAVGGVPADYTLPGAVELILKAVTAEFTDNGAASAWLPCVEIISDSGHVIARACDQGVSVAAGASAEVSWFPRVGRGAGGSVSGGTFPFLILQGIQLPVSHPGVGDDDHGKFDASKKFTNNPSVWTYDLDGSGRIKAVHVKTVCLLDVTLQYEWQPSGVATDLTTLINIFTGSETFNGVTMFGVSPADRITTAADVMGTLRAIFPNTNTVNGKTITVQPNQVTLASLDFTPTYLSILQLPLNPT